MKVSVWSVFPTFEHPAGVTSAATRTWTHISLPTANCVQWSTQANLKHRIWRLKPVSEVVGECFFSCTTQAPLVLFFFCVRRNSHAPQAQSRLDFLKARAKGLINCFLVIFRWITKGGVQKDLLVAEKTVDFYSFGKTRFTVRKIRGNQEITTKGNRDKEQGRGMKRPRISESEWLKETER